MIARWFCGLALFIGVGDAGVLISVYIQTSPDGLKIKKQNKTVVVNAH